MTIEGDTWQATARPATPPEREEIWAKGVEIMAGHRDEPHKDQTNGEVKKIILEHLPPQP